MSIAAKCIVLFLIMSVTLVVPSFPPAQLLFQVLKIPQTTFFVSFLKSIVNGLIWVFMIIEVYDLTHRNNKLKALPPMPAAPYLPAPPLEPMISRELYWDTNTISPLNTEETKLPQVEKDNKKPLFAETQIQEGSQIVNGVQIEKPQAPNQRMQQSSSKIIPCPHNIRYFSQPHRSRKIPVTCLACEHVISCATRPTK